MWVASRLEKHMVFGYVLLDIPVFISMRRMRWAGWIRWG